MNNAQTPSTGTARLIVPALGPLYAILSRLSWPIVRVFTGLMLMPHGAQKLFGWFGGNGFEATAQGFEQYFGLAPGLLWAGLTGGTEFFGGLLLVLGLLTRPAAVGAVILMAVAVVKVHLPNGFFWSNGGYEYPLLWGLMALAIAFRGGSEMSLDRAIGREF